jgi:endoglucanase/chitinase
MATPLLLPAGPLTTLGNQIVDGSGNPVRIACLGWTGSNFRGGVPEGLDQAVYTALLDQVKAIGFNCIRLGFCDASVIHNDSPNPGYVNTSLNPTMAGLSCLGVHDLIITYCGTIGLRVIIDSHNNEGNNTGNFGANQPNGLWYDLGGGSDGTDQGGNTGTVTDAAFLAMWQSIATRYKSFAAILGYDLRNEPNTTGTKGAGNGGGSTWGDGSNRDIRAMYQRVGNAILAIDSRPLIICEGPQNYNGTFATGTFADGIAYGSGANFTGGSGDLTGVRTAPVVLTTSGKVVYSAHEYPPETSGNLGDAGGQTKINQMTAVWGWLIKDGIAPVWIGEMGSYFNGTAAQIASSTTWANMMVAYCAGTASGGPSFTGAQQGIGTDWWVLAVDESGGQVPDFGILTAWRSGTPRANQLAVYSQFFYLGPAGSGIPPGSAGPASPNGTIVTTVGPAITDANGNLWTLTAGGQIAVNGTIDPLSSGVIELAYVSSLIWRLNVTGQWFAKSTPTDTWTLNPTPFGNAPVASPPGTIVTTVGPAIADANGNLWTITAGGQVAVNGVADTTTTATSELAFVGNAIWKALGTSTVRWQFKLLTTDPWLPIGGTLTNPLTAAGATPAGIVWNIHNGLPAWLPASVTALGARCSNAGVAYQCVAPGTTAANGGPQGTSGNILDGTARWKFLSNVDFTDRSGAIAALPTTFTTNITLQFWNTANQTTPAAVPFFTLSGHTLGAFTLTLTAAPQDSIRTFLSAQSTPLMSNSAGGVTFLQPLAAVGAAINYATIADGGVILDGLEFIDPCPTSGSTILQIANGTGNLLVRNCIFDGTTQPGGATMLDIGATAGGVTFTNCLFIDRQLAGGTDPTVQMAIVAGTPGFANCTFIAPNGAANTAVTNSGSAFVSILNCAFFGYGNAAGFQNCTLSNNATSAAGWASGNNISGNILNLVASAQFINAMTDFRTLAGSALLNVAFTDPADIPAGDDITGLARNQGPGWDIGCWERPSFNTAELRTQPNKFW